jgi:alpha/beta superfamily hydrolase
MSETPFYFPNGNYQLFGILYRPEKMVRDTGFVFVHPFAEEKLWTQRVYVNFARELAQHGYPVLRFDEMGHGDSEGNFEESTIETRLSDINSAIAQIRKDIPEIKKIGLLGLRFGATLASLAAEKSELIHQLILWEPIVDGEKYMQEMLRINLTTQTAVYKK